MENKTETVIYDQLIGKIFSSVKNENDDELIFKGVNSYMFHHIQDCCENVEINDITGDLKDLEGSPITQAEMTYNVDIDNHSEDSTTWTFYRFSSEKGSVTVKWKGTSNGYYSETVDFTPIK